MGRIGSPETSVRKYLSTLHTIPKEGRSHLHHGGSLKSRRGWGYRASKFYSIFCKLKAIRVFRDTLTPNGKRNRRSTISWWAILLYFSPNYRVYYRNQIREGNTWCVQVLRSPKEVFAAAMQSWRERCEKCVCLQGDYVEKWLHFQLPVVSSFF